MKNKIVIILIILLAGFLRFNQLSTNPPSLTWDEASWGYNAYSLGIDGRDEFGRFLPYDYLESFGDFKPPVYAYLTVIPVKIFGLNEFSTRFASAFFGTLTVLITYLVSKRLFDKSKIENGKLNIGIPIISAFILALSPWHIMLSRAAFEANVATFFIVLGVWLFLEAVHGKSYFLIFSVISFVLSIYTFNSARIVAPILLICLSFGYYKKILRDRKILIISIIVGLFLVLPIAKFLTSPQASLRFREVNIFSNPAIVNTSNQEIANDNNAWWSKFIHNRRFAYGREIVSHYFDNLSLEFLFIKGDGNPKFSTGDVGQMYIWDLPFFVVGILFLLKKRQEGWWILPLWLFIGIIPASLARETPHALRIEGSLPTFQIFTAYGVVTALIWLRKRNGILRKLAKPIIAGVVLVLFFNFLSFIHGYYTHYTHERSVEWQYGYKESLEYVRSVENKYSTIKIGTSLGRPYIYTLFYAHYDPQKFRKEAIVERESLGFVHIKKFGKYEFPEGLSNEKTGNMLTLFIDAPQMMPKSGKILKTFNLLNGQPALVAYTL